MPREHTDMGIATAITRDISGRIDAVGWGSLFLMTGIVMLIPGLPEGTWLVGLGVIVLAANAARVVSGLAAQAFGVILGACAVVGGLGEMAGLDLPVFPMFLIACGIAIIGSQLTKGGLQA